MLLFNFRSSPPMATAHNKKRDVKKTLADRDVQHWLRHRCKTWLRCKYAKRVRFWQKLTVISELRTSWLEGQKDKDGNWFLGCKACARNSVDTVFGQHRVTKLAKFTILQHSGKLSHQESVAKMTGVPFERKLAPPRKHWEETFDAMVDGRSYKKGVKQVGTQHKMRKMVWCIAEAMRDADRNFMTKLASLTVIRDESKAKLVIRYIASDVEANVQRGHCAVVSEFGTGSVNIVGAFRTAFKQMFTLGLGAPSTKKRKPKRKGSSMWRRTQQLCPRLNFLLLMPPATRH